MSARGRQVVFPAQARSQRHRSAESWRYHDPAAVAHALGFSADDLMANRRGALSERQAWRLRRDAAMRLGQAAAVCLPVFVLLTLLFNAPTIDGVLWALLLTGIPFVGIAWGLWPAIQDANELAVHQVSGFVTGERWTPAKRSRLGRAGRFGGRYALCIDGERFPTSRKVYLSFVPGRYTLYFTPRARQVVGAEAVARQP